MKSNYIKQYKMLGLTSILFFTPSVYAETVSLQDILRYSLTYDPTLDEARANVAYAESQTKISQAGHYPVLSATNTQILSQYHRHSSDRENSGPGLRAKVNVYSWGAIESEVERDKHKQEYYQHKFSETREEVGRTVGQLYLTALRAKETLAVYKESLERHQKMHKNLDTVASYDAGRRFEVTEAESREIQVEANIAQQEKILYNALSRLSRYSKKPMLAEHLQDPFKDMDPQRFITSYRNQDIKTVPTYQAQQKEFDSTRAAVDVAKARRLPALDLEGTATRNDRSVYVNLSWDFFNLAASEGVEQFKHSQSAADAKLREITLEVEQQARTAEIDIIRNHKLAGITHKQIKTQRKVVEDTEAQFHIASRSLMNVLDAYQELSGVQLSEVSARNDLRDAALTYLVSQARVSEWAGAVSLSLHK